ncbi:MAG: sugar phosphate nucleotidyltransferase [Minisyncoccales bacterium]
MAENSYETLEKPEDKDKIEEFRLDEGTKNSLQINKEYDFLASMGNYVFYKDKLKKYLELDEKDTDFGNDIIPKIKESGGALYAHPFNGYWRDVGQVGDYFDCHMDFVLKTPPIDLIKHRIRTVMRYLPGPQAARDAQLSGNIRSNGTKIRNKSRVQNSVLGYQVTIDKNCKIKKCIFLGADRNQYYQNQLKKKNTTFVDHDTEIEKAIIDKNVEIGSNVKLSPDFGTPEERRKNLESIGLEPYKEEAGKIKGDFYIEPDRNILVIGKKVYPEKNKIVIPSGFNG